jgi:hypothetical protein
MPGCCSTISYPPLIKRLGRRKQFQIVTFVSLTSSQTCKFIGCNSNRRHSPIHVLNDDVLLNIFHLYRLADPDEYDNGVMTLYCWHRQRWWYKLAHVCRLWRNIILESPSRLDLHLYCTNGVPVADMLAHSPPLPLTIDYSPYQCNYRVISAADESDILLALSHRDRVRRIGRLPDVARFVTAMDGQFPVLERMYINSGIEVVFPETFQAPNLRHLSLTTASLLIGSPLLTTTAAGIVTLTLYHNTGFLTDILTWLSLMVQLERLFISIAVLNHDVERQLHQTSDMTTLPNLHRFVFQGTARYLEDLVARISTPSLSTLHIGLFDQPSESFTVPHLIQFMQASENLRFHAVQVTFGPHSVSLHVVPWKWDTSLMLEIRLGRLDWQVASAAQLFGTLSPVLSVVEQVAFSYEKHIPSLETPSNIDRRQWRELLMPFTNAKTICVQDDLIDKIFRCLPSDDGEPPLELLPNLEEVGYSGASDALDAFTTFLNERHESGHPVRLRLVDGSMFNKPPVP